MNGGLFEGIKKVYKSPNAAMIHGIVLAAMAIISGIMAFAYLQLPADVAEASRQQAEGMLYAYLFTKQPLLGIFMLIISFLMGGYMINLTHKAIKIFAAEEHNPERAEKEPLLPEFNIKEAAKQIIPMLVMSIVWVFYFVLVIIGIGLIFNLIKLPILAGIVLIIGSLISVTIFPMIFTKYADNYELKPQLNPVNVITITQKAFWSILWLSIKFFGLSILFGILNVIITVIIGFLFGAFSKGFAIFLSTTIVMYISIILSFAFYYSIAYIYNKKIKSQE